MSYNPKDRTKNVENPEFVWKKETQGSYPSTNALVCGETKQGEKHCEFIEGYNQDETPRDMMEIVNKGWGVQAVAGTDSPINEVDASNPSKENIRGEFISLGF